MNEKWPIFILLIIISLCFACESEKSEVELPNIVFIISDDQAWTDYGFIGHDHINTPNIDQMAKESLTFSKGYVPTSLCAPSLASIITGMYPRKHLVLGNDRILPGDDISKGGAERHAIRSQNYESVIDHFTSLQTLPKMLKEKGYLSFQTGKWWLGNYSNGGFDIGMTHGDTARRGRHGDFGLEIGRKGLDTLYSYIDMAVDKKKPFFMWYAPFLPHSPHNPPDSLLQKYLPLASSEYVAKYWAMCEWFDKTCGDLMEYVDDKGLMENTLFVYVCDNGWIQNENDSRFNKLSKRSPYDYGIRTPIMYKWKGKIAAKMDTESLTSSLDIVPTVLDLVGIDRPKELDGINVLDANEMHHREEIFGEIYEHDFSSIDSSLNYRMLISDPYKLILPNEINKANESVQLFDLDKDPTEQINIAEMHPDIVKNLTNKIEVSWRQDLVH